MKHFNLFLMERTLGEKRNTKTARKKVLMTVIISGFKKKKKSPHNLFGEKSERKRQSIDLSEDTAKVVTHNPS